MDTKHREYTVPILTAGHSELVLEPLHFWQITIMWPECPACQPESVQTSPVWLSVRRPLVLARPVS
jgi:hypothetical protein